jgi:DNA-binding NarL/FixJ family response regulator
VTELLRRLGLSSRTEAALFFSSRAAPAAMP